MRIVIAGHVFALDMLDVPKHVPDKTHMLKFVMRNHPAEKYPLNASAFRGTTSQECLRALIARHLYLIEQCHLLNDITSAVENRNIVILLRTAIFIQEKRAARKHGRELTLTGEQMDAIENMPTCPNCGHIKPEEHADCKA